MLALLVVVGERPHLTESALEFLADLVDRRFRPDFICDAIRMLWETS
jgi:hypothetical protein